MNFSEAELAQPRGFCPLCTVSRKPEPCSRCRWFLAIGAIVEGILWIHPEHMTHRGGESGRWYVTQTYADQWRALDAIAAICIERWETRRRHNRELRDEQREAGRAARDSYYEGRAEGARENGGW